jgi:hypothetical protein
LSSTALPAALTVDVSFILLYKVTGPFIFFISLLLMVWGGL